jgi:hypothetical protein
VVARPFDRERAGEVLEAGAGGLRVRVSGRGRDQDDQPVRLLRRERVGADGVPGGVERLLGVGVGRPVDQRAGPLCRPQLAEPRRDGAVVGLEPDAREDAFAEDGGWVRG